MNSNTKKKAISNAVRVRVRKRDGGCIFCRTNSFAICATKDCFEYKNTRTEIMHYISRGRGGLGIEENLAEGCIYHHRQLDQGDGKELRAYFKEYLMSQYPDWDEEKLICRNRWDLSTEQKK